jgi:acyl-CoA reductase-like NAD-dependent aldehyde dehydrogenase
MTMSINHALCKSGRAFAVSNPANGELLCELHGANGNDAELVVEAATKVLAAWLAKPLAKSKKLNRVCL